MDKDKHKRHSEWCKGYKARGQREINKKIKQERHQRRVEKFVKRREEGKSYKYQPNPYEKGTRVYEVEKLHREIKYMESCEAQMGEFQRWARNFGRLNSVMRQIHEEERMAQIKNRKLKQKGKMKKEEENIEMV